MDVPKICIYLCIGIIVEADIRDPLYEKQMYNGALRGDIKIKINQIQSDIFKTRKQEPNISKSNQYDTDAKKIFQYDWN